MTNPQGVKVHIDLPNHPAIGGESFWADALGDDRYQLANIPFFAYGLNFKDIVRATPEGPDQILEIREVVEPSGHRTLRVLFDDEVDRERQAELLDVLRPLQATYERATGDKVAITVAPEGEYLDVYDQLDAWADDGLLDFETCHERVEGSFDDAPDES